MKTFSDAKYTTATLLLGGMLVWSGAQQAIGAATQPNSLADVPIPEDKAKIEQLNIALVVFDPGTPGYDTLQRQKGVFSKIREVEARYLPYLLRETLVETDQWGAVRVVPEPDPTAELLVSGTIVKSDGVTLELQLRAVDSTMREWLNKTYAVSAAHVDDPPDSGYVVEPFQQLYDQVANDLHAARARLNDKELSTIAEVSLLRYASELAPEAFGDYLQTGPAGTLEIHRLPARDDPMLDRVGRIRQFEYLFTDTTDEQYQALHSEIASTYDLWRQYRRQQVKYTRAEKERKENSKPQTFRGSYGAMKHSYDNYQWAKIQEQKLEKWAAGFNNEVAPTVIELEGRIVELNGDLEARYVEWRNILQSIFALETGEQIQQ